MNRQYTILASLALLILSSLAAADSPAGSPNWAEAARLARAANTPMLILYTAPECGYCERLKAEVLEPLFGDERNNRRAMLREVDIHAGGKMTDFDGESIRSRQFKQRYHVFATPTLLVLDANGRLMTDPIIGYDSQARYAARLNDLFEKLSADRLSAAHHPRTVARNPGH